MARKLFVKRFAVRTHVAGNSKIPVGRYDEVRSYNVMPNGTPSVEAEVRDSTHTITAVGGELIDNDRAWDFSASTDTITKANLDRDHWLTDSTDTTTRAGPDRDHWSS
jgi:hypothetical protein